MNCIVYASSSINPPFTVGVVLKCLGCKLVVIVQCNFSNDNRFLENENKNYKRIQYSKIGMLIGARNPGTRKNYPNPGFKLPESYTKIFKGQ